MPSEKSITFNVFNEKKNANYQPAKKQPRNLSILITKIKMLSVKCLLVRKTRKQRI